MKLIAFAALAGAVSASAAVPTVSGVSFTQEQQTRFVTVAYTLADGPAVVTVDIQTNAAGAWASIGEENFTTLKGDVNKFVQSGERSISWDARTDWPDRKIDGGNMRAVVTAWSPDDTPDYMVVDITPSVTDRIFYYVSKNALPGGLFANAEYRTSKIVMKRIHAKGKSFAMGSICEPGTSNKERPYTVTLTNDYYMGVFEVTQSQWREIYGTTVPAACSVEGAMRPMDTITYARIRESNANTANASYLWPEAPHPQSFCGLLRTCTKCDMFENGIDFDLPSKAQWQFACRAGTCDGYWNNGAPITSSSEDPALPGRYSKNQAAPDNTDTTGKGVDNCSAICGSYPPNAWGLYDMHGNVWEFCLDLYTDNAETLASQAGAVNTTVGSDRVRCGGSWRASASDCRAAYAYYSSTTTGANHCGMRLWCRAGLR